MKQNITAKLVEEARGAASAKELLALAQENGIELTEEEAEAYFEKLHRSGEMSDEELDNVAGGGCYTNWLYDGASDFLVVTNGYSCELWECNCGGKSGFASGFGGSRVACKACGSTPSCGTCRYRRHRQVGYYCENPANRRK